MKKFLIKLLLFVIWLSIFLGASYMILKEIRTNDFSKLTKVWMVSTIFILVALPISLYGILQHLINYNKPYLQLYIIRILWMVPIYAMNAWVALRFPKSAIYLDTLRECYEAYVIYNFTTFLLNYLKCSLDLVATLEEKRSVSHIFPANLILPKWKPGWPFIQNCKRGVLQYTVVRPLMTVIAFITEMFGVYNEGIFSFKFAWIYTVLINNISQIFAMYCLIVFYKATYQELKPMKPLGKFFCVKAIVFASFWQSVLIAFLVHSHILTESNTWQTRDSQSLQASLQDFCICIEMFIASIAHYFCFPAQPYVMECPQPNANETNILNGNQPSSGNIINGYTDPNGIQTFDDVTIISNTTSCNEAPHTFLGSVWHSLKLMFNVSDVYEDVHQQVNIMIKSGALKNRYRDKLLQNTNIMATLPRDDNKILYTNKNNNFGGNNFSILDEDDRLVLDACCSTHNNNTDTLAYASATKNTLNNLDLFNASANIKDPLAPTMNYKKLKDEIA